MTTPQSILHQLEYHVRNLCGLLEGNEHTGDITERLAQMEIEMSDVVDSQMRLENLMHLIVKLLRHEEKATQSCVKTNTTQDCVNNEEKIP